MTGDTREAEILMGPNDLCTLLSIKESTLRKYALLLKDAGYQFHVNEKGQRGYFNRDVIVFKRFLEVKNNRDMTLEQAANAVVSWVKQSGISLHVIENLTENTRYDTDIQELKILVNKQNDLIKDLIKRMDQQQKYIDERLNKRDKRIEETIKESQETKKFLLEAKEAQAEKKQRKGIMKWFMKD